MSYVVRLKLNFPKRYYKFTDITEYLDDSDYDDDNEDKKRELPKIGELVRVIRNEEGFFCEVVEIRENDMILKVKNNLFANDIMFDELIILNKRYVSY